VVGRKGRRWRWGGGIVRGDEGMERGRQGRRGFLLADLRAGVDEMQ
jgi:hypothetical protein